MTKSTRLQYSSTGIKTASVHVVRYFDKDTCDLSVSTSSLVVSPILTRGDLLEIWKTLGEALMEWP